MADDLKKAEQSAVNAAQAMVRLLDFSMSVGNELGKVVAELSGLKKTRTEPLRMAMQDAYVIHRYTTGQTQADAVLYRYLFVPFVVPYNLKPNNYRERLIPFILVSLINSENRPPSIVYGMLGDGQGRERTDQSFLEHYLLWLNEGLNTIKKDAKSDQGVWRLRKELMARATSQMLTADVSFGECPLLDCTADNLAERAESIASFIAGELLAVGGGVATVVEKAPRGPRFDPGAPKKKDDKKDGKKKGKRK